MSAPAVRERPTPAETWWWAWSADEEESWEGPFATREAAEADARVAMAIEVGTAPVVAPASKPDVGEIAVGAVGHLEDFTERMCEIATDEAWYSGDDDLFEAKDSRAAAELALNDVIRKWAEEHLTVTSWTIRTDEAEPVRAEGAA